jgi:F-type H+-transporting ATPase subunit alpha
MAVLKAVNAGLFDEIPLEEVAQAESRIQQRVTSELPELCSRMESGEKLDGSQWQQVLEQAKQALAKSQNSTRK